MSLILTAAVALAIVGAIASAAAIIGAVCSDVHWYIMGRHTARQDVLAARIGHINGETNETQKLHSYD